MLIPVPSCNGVINIDKQWIQYLNDRNIHVSFLYDNEMLCTRCWAHYSGGTELQLLYYQQIEGPFDEKSVINFYDDICMRADSLIALIKDYDLCKQIGKNTIWVVLDDKERKFIGYSLTREGAEQIITDIKDFDNHGSTIVILETKPGRINLLSCPGAVYKFDKDKKKYKIVECTK